LLADFFNNIGQKRTLNLDRRKQVLLAVAYQARVDWRFAKPMRAMFGMLQQAPFSVRNFFLPLVRRQIPHTINPRASTVALALKSNQFLVAKPPKTTRNTRQRTNVLFMLL
jgi:hypothetical protein